MVISNFLYFKFSGPKKETQSCFGLYLSSTFCDKDQVFTCWVTYMHIDHMYPQPKENVCRIYRLCLRSHQNFEFFLVVTMKKTFFGSKNSKFRIRYHHRNVFTYLCVKDHVSKLWRLLKKWTKGTFILRPTFVCLRKKNGCFYVPLCKRSCL